MSRLKNVSTRTLLEATQAWRKNDEVHRIFGGVYQRNEDLHEKIRDLVDEVVRLRSIKEEQKS